MMVIFGTLSGVYIIPTIYEDYVSLERAAKNKGSADSDNASLDTDVDDFARNSINDVYSKAKALKANSSVVRFIVIFSSFFVILI